MGAAKRLEMTTERQYLLNALKAGKARIEDLSLKALIVDPAYQAREKHLDMGHVRKLGEMLDIGIELEPCVAFEHPETKTLKLIGGFHRHKQALVRKETFLRCYVVTGDDQEAVLFAAMSNQETLLERTDDDKRKAVAMVLGLPECRDWPIERIAAHVGISPSTAAKYRLLYFEQAGIPVPTRQRQPDPPASRRPTKADTLPFREPIEPPPVVESSAQSLDRKALKAFFLKHDILLRLPEAHGTPVEVLALGGFEIEGCACVSLANDDPEDYALAVGRVLLYRQWLCRQWLCRASGTVRGTRAVVLCAPHEHSALLRTYGEALGIEFLSPAEMLASIRPDDQTAV